MFKLLYQRSKILSGLLLKVGRYGLICFILIYENCVFQLRLTTSTKFQDSLFINWQNMVNTWALPTLLSASHYLLYSLLNRYLSLLILWNYITDKHAFTKRIILTCILFLKQPNLTSIVEFLTLIKLFKWAA